MRFRSQATWAASSARWRRWVSTIFGSMVSRCWRTLLPKWRLHSSWTNMIQIQKGKMRGREVEARRQRRAAGLGLTKR